MCVWISSIRGSALLFTLMFWSRWCFNTILKLWWESWHGWWLTLCLSELLHLNKFHNFLHLSVWELAVELIYIKWASNGCTAFGLWFRRILLDLLIERFTLLFAIIVVFLIIFVFRGPEWVRMHRLSFIKQTTVYLMWSCGWNTRWMHFCVGFNDWNGRNMYRYRLASPYCFLLSLPLEV